ncbi:MAG: hypothetical protein M1820_008491 [Bogoriella megaspora]|nr:MAG: hypothetical protein M1820_008491 [Bogoriella megaspora]
MFASRVVRSRIQYRNLLSQRNLLTRRTLHFRKPPDDSSVQRVRFKKPSIFNWKRLATFGLYSGCVTAYLYFVFPEVEIEEEEIPEGEEEEDGEGGEDGEDDYESDEDSLFIPLGFAKKKERTYYKGSDPEWQEFLKLARDKTRHQRVQNDLVDLVMRHLRAHVPLSSHFGGTPKSGRVWLDMNFPNGPPPEYERTGIVISEDFIAIARRTTTEQEEERMNRALWPRAAFSSIWAGVRLIYRMQWIRIKESLGIQTKLSKEEEGIRKRVQIAQQWQEERVGRNGANGPQNASDLANKQQSSEPRQDRSQSLPTTKGIAATASSLSNLPTPSLPPPGSEFPLAMHIFIHRMAASRSFKKTEPPRGTCVLSGLIEVQGTKARATLDVRAFYHPQLGQFVAVSAALRSFKLKNQRPLGGP